MIKQAMRVQKYQVWVHLGCTLEEQKFTQPVHVDINIDFHKDVSAAYTDQLKDAVDYVFLTNEVKRIAQAKPYHLIEHLCYEILVSLANSLKNQFVDGYIAVELKKLRVPVENLTDGVVYRCETAL